MGINVFVWNYRGYGSSCGTASPMNLCKDGEFIYDYLKNVLKYERIGVHGESLGGMVAVHVANTKQPEFLCADRTFSSLDEVGLYMLGQKYQYLFKFATFWKLNPAREFLSVNCYKVCCFDKYDEIIPYMAILQNGVAREYLHQLRSQNSYEDELQVRSGRRRSLLNLFKTRYNQGKQYCKLVFKRGVNNSLQWNATDLLKHSAQLHVFYAIERLSGLMNHYFKNKSEEMVYNEQQIAQEKAISFLEIFEKLRVQFNTFQGSPDDNIVAQMQSLNEKASD